MPISIWLRPQRGRAGKSVAVAAWLRCASGALRDAKLVIEASNLTAGKRYRAEVARIDGSLCAVSLDPKALGQGNGAVQVSLVAGTGAVLGSASAVFEIMADPFGE